MIRVDRPSFRGGVVAFAAVGLLFLAFLEVSYRRSARTHEYTISALDSLGRVRLHLTAAYVAAQAFQAADPTFDGSRAGDELDRAIQVLDDWMGGRSALLGIRGEPIQSPAVLAAAREYRGHILELRSRLQDGEAEDAVVRRLLFTEADRAAGRAEALAYGGVRDALRQEERTHWAGMVAWSLLLAATTTALIALRRARERAVQRRAGAEEGRRELEARYMALLDLAPVGVIRCDARGHILEANGWWHTRVMGRPEGGVVAGGLSTPDVPWWDALPAGEAEHVCQEWQEKRAAGAPFFMAFHLPGSPAPDRRFEGWWSPQSTGRRGERGTGGGAVAWVGAFQDVTDRVLLEGRLRQAEKLEAVGQLTGGIAHDFNNLLTVIVGNLELIRYPGTSPGDATAALADVETAARSGQGLIQSLLSFSRRSDLHLVPLSLGESVDHATRMARRLLPGEVELDCILPPTELLIRGDGTAIQQIILNLLVNARDAMPRGGKILVQVDRAPGGAGDRVTPPGVGPVARIRVTDTGGGMSPETLQRIFDPFFTTKPRGEGTGLGLATVHGLVQQHGGSITVDSEPGTGTTFWIHLPELVPLRAGRSGEDDPSTTPAGAPTPRRTTVLLVEDDADLRRTAARVLIRLGYEVVAVGTGREALDHMSRDTPFDLILSDLDLPGMSGLELRRILKARGPVPPFLFTSGQAPLEVARAGLLPEGSRFLAKPWTMEQLAAAVQLAAGGDARVG